MQQVEISGVDCDGHEDPADIEEEICQECEGAVGSE